MGLISFIKNAGASIFGGSDAKAAPAEELKKELDKHGLDSSNVKIEVEGDKVKVSGTASSTEQAEKIAIALGNTVGVQTVQNDIKPAKAEPESKFYTVKSGDTLWHIADTQYAKGTARKTTSSFRPTDRCCRIRTRSIRARSCAFRRCPEDAYALT